MVKDHQQNVNLKKHRIKDIWIKTVYKVTF